eukprot:4135938-Karenia_brevis.AAC.1
MMMILVMMMMIMIPAMACQLTESEVRPILKKDQDDSSAAVSAQWGQDPQEDTGSAKAQQQGTAWPNGAPDCYSTGYTAVP